VSWNPKSWLRQLATDTASDVFKDVGKTLFYVAAGVVTAWVVSGLNLWQDEPRPISLERIPVLLWRSFVNIFADPGDWTQFILDRPKRAIPAMLLVFLVFLLAALLYKSYITIANQRRLVRESAANKALVDKFGIGGRWPHCRRSGEGGAPWEELIKEIERPGNGSIDILGANGIDTFGDIASPLYDILGHFKSGPIRVILAAPDKGIIAGRAMNVGMDARDYVKAILKSQARLRELKEHHLSVDGRYYTGEPNWKMIITSRTVWVQYYSPGGPHVDQTPVYRFDANDDGQGLYYLFKMEFERIWRRCESSPMKLKK
jgi:hypothetical protein